MLAPAATVTHLKPDMNIELDEVVQDVSDDALEQAAGGAQRSRTAPAALGANPCAVYPY